jgi:hypothetical protein
VYAEWIIPSQLNEAYKNAQNHSSDSTSIPAVRAQDHNPITADAIEKRPSSVAKNIGSNMILDGRNIVISCNSPLYLLQYAVSNTITAISNKLWI